MTQVQAARIQHVSRRSVQYAAEVLRSGHQDLIDAIDRGEIKVWRAVCESRRRRGDRDRTLRDRVRTQMMVYRRQAEAAGDHGLAEACGIFADGLR